jgi:hypothetical protein
MSFNIQARGTRAEVVSSIDQITSTQLGNDPLGARMRDLLVDVISGGTDLEPPADQRYLVNVSGHSGPNSAVTMTAKVELVPFPYAAPAAAQDKPAEAESWNPTEKVSGADELHHS